jgi:hypothetical protein
MFEKIVYKENIATFEKSEIQLIGVNLLNKGSRHFYAN